MATWQSIETFGQSRKRKWSIPKELAQSSCHVAILSSCILIRVIQVLGICTKSSLALLVKFLHVNKYSIGGGIWTWPFLFVHVAFLLFEENWKNSWLLYLPGGQQIIDTYKSKLQTVYRIHNYLQCIDNCFYVGFHSLMWKLRAGKRAHAFQC